MKKLLFLLAICSLTSLANAQQKNDTTIVFDKTIHDFGDITMKGGSSCTFEFTNKGEMPLIIQTVSASCGCTNPDWTKEPVAPGARGFVKVTYNPTGIMPFSRTLVVYSNGTPAAIVLRLRGKVVAGKN